MNLPAFFRNLLAPFKGGLENLVDAPQATPTIKAGPLTISRESYELILEFEIGGRKGYKDRTEWPGASSGLTIGIGYDIGYNSPGGIKADWHGLLPVAALERLSKLSGITGQAASKLPRQTRDIIIPWASAETVFNENSMQRFGRLTVDTFPGVTKLDPHIQGVLLSLVFNRGNSLDGERRAEMREIRRLVGSKNLREIPFQIRKMKRLWINKGVDGLLRRREAEAKLVESAL